MDINFCNGCDFLVCLDVADKWIDCKCTISKPERKRLIQIIEDITDKISTPVWCPLKNKE
jgi:hypothetical protein